MSKLKVVELFAGVGGFRIGLEATGRFEVIWSNQFEPSTKAQHASWIYESVFGSKGHTNESIEDIPTSQIPDCDVLVGGFPCQDYSVATTLKNSKGLMGKKGVLWWSINRILSEKKNKPKYLILENVDRLLKSPSNQRGRDFAVMLKCLQELGYAVEWRVINAAEYGFPQRRRRVFIVAYLEGTKECEQINKNPIGWLDLNGVLSRAFPINEINDSDTFDFTDSLSVISDEFGKGDKLSKFSNCGVMVGNKFYTVKALPRYDGKYKKLRDVIDIDYVDESFFIPEEDLDKWNYLKGAKKEIRVSTSGYEYNYSEGGMIFPDDLEGPSRTIITGEGGKSPSRFKHVININGKLRRLVPIELERLNGFPDNHTKLEGVSDAKRAFLMGNALVCGIVERIGNSLIQDNGG